ncbi:MAG: apolipoprotein N-acyltransferase [Trueperaceae bacterium]
MRIAPVLVSAAAGALLSAALPPTGIWPLLLALVPLFAYTARSERPRGAFWVGFAFGLTFFTLYVLWLPASFASPDFFGSFFWLLYPPLLLVLASFWGLVTLAARLIGGGGLLTLALLPPLWILMEWARTQGYFAFPWGTLGYAWLDTPVGQLADIFGVWGLGLLTTTVTALLAAPFVPVSRAPAPFAAAPAATRRTAFRGGRSSLGALLLAPLAALALLTLGWWGGSVKLARQLPAPNLTALLVQGNIDPFGRLTGAAGEVEIQANLSRQVAQELPSPPDLVIWPEGAVLGGLVGESGRQSLEQVQESVPGAVFLVGARANIDGSSFNSAYTIEDGRLLDRYDKHYLVPFGERFPFADAAAPLYRAVFGLFRMAPVASTSQGDGLEPLATPFGSVAAYICYESVFPQVQREMVRSGAQLLVNITNDAWFSRGDGAQQHYAMGRMRAIETRRYLLRAGNDGITGVVDPLGNTVEQLERGVPEVMSAGFAMLDEFTLYVRYGHLLLPLLGIWITAAVVARLSTR